MRKNYDNNRTLTGHDNEALYFRDDSSSCGSSRENIRLGPFIDFGNELEKEFPRVSSQVPLSPRGDEDDRSYQYSEAEVERGTWTGKFDFLLSLLGYSVGLGNVWRFPYLCYSNGGGAFLIPFICMMLLAGLPLMFMELSFGQYASLGPIAIFDRFCPLFTGLGYGMVIVSGTVMLYYNMIIAWTIFYMFASWNSQLPWEHCKPEWSTPADMDISIVAVLILLFLQKTLCDNFRNSSVDNALPSADIIIYTSGGPVPEYLLNSPYKIVALPNRSFARRADDPRTTEKLSNKEAQNSTIVEDIARDISIRYRPQTSNRQLSKQRKQKNRNRFGGSNPERYNQRLVSSDDVRSQQKGQATSSTQEKNIANPDQSEASVYNIDFNKLTKAPFYVKPNRNVKNSDPSQKPVYVNDANKLTTSSSNLYRERNVLNSDQSQGPVYINDGNKLTTAPSNLYPDKNVVYADVSNGPVYNNDGNKLTTATSSLFPDKNVVYADVSNGPVYINDVTKLTTIPSFLLPNENFPTPLAYSPLSTTYSTNPSFLASKIPTPSTKLNKFPRPAVKEYETASYNKPYSFGYDVFDGYGTKQYRQESATGDGVVRGNYGYKDYQGIYRQVEYTADENGFHAVLKSNEPGLANVDSADVSASVEPPPLWPPSEN
ncbi:Sodium-dependent proline transporter like protein [Argiope bruennichi]|uniref:Transporter n=1 Tax=Argiope bruennichi TaxID=94029 RepID=A0A8T0E8T6_ARGBR|nr:Sodium-dependent proline transporter like protein [Argiope bruennichi]